MYYYIVVLELLFCGKTSAEKEREKKNQYSMELLAVTVDRNHYNTTHRYAIRAQIDKKKIYNNGYLHEIRNYIDYRRHLLFLVWITLETSYLIQSSPGAIHVIMILSSFVQSSCKVTHGGNSWSYYVYYFNWHNIIS